MRSNEEIMQELFDFANLKMDKNNAYPFCGFVVKNGVILSKGYNMRIQQYRDATTHGEIEAIKKAIKAVSPDSTYVLNGYSLYGTCEPCLSCFEAALNCGINSFYYSVGPKEFPHYFHDHTYTLKDYMNDSRFNKVHIQEGILRDKGITLFNKAREKYGW